MASLNKAVGLWSALALFAACGGPEMDESTAKGPELAEQEAELTARASDWFPLSVGNDWVMTSSTTGAQHHINVDHEGNGFFYVGGLDRVDGKWLAFGTTATSTLFAWNADSSGWSSFVRFSQMSSPWDYSPSGGACDQFVVRRSKSNVKVTTPAGAFTKGRTFSFSLNPPPYVRCVAPLFQELTFVQGVGLVSFVSGTGETFLLESAQVGATQYPAPVPVSTLSASVSTDRAVYLNKPNTIRCVTTPCPTNAVTALASFSFTVTNTGSTSKQVRFSHGQQFEFDVLDAGGKVVTAWSDSQSFTAAATSFTLAAGASRTFSGQVPMLDRKGLQLDGTYVVRGKLTATNVSPALTSTSIFRVDEQP